MRLHSFRTMAAAAAALFAVSTGGAAVADTVRTASNLKVPEAVANMKAAIEASGSRVFTVARFDKGAASVGVVLRPTATIIFGGPQIGAEALPEHQLMALHLPLRVLAYEDAAGKTWLAYSDMRDEAAASGLVADHPGVVRMREALAAAAKAGTGD